MKPSKRQKQKCIDLIEQMDFLFSTNNYTRTLNFGENKPEEYVAADVTINIPYQRIHINIYPAYWEQDKYAQRMSILHEFCHAIVKPLQDVCFDLQEGKLRTTADRKDAVEHVTSRIAQLLDAQLRGRNKYARDAYEKYLKK